MGNLYSGVINVSIDNSGFTAVSLPTGTQAKSFVCKCRNDDSFMISNVAAGTTYITFPSSWEDKIETSVSNTLFYVKASSGATTFEVLLREY